MHHQQPSAKLIIRELFKKKLKLFSLLQRRSDHENCLEHRCDGGYLHNDHRPGHGRLLQLAWRLFLDNNDYGRRFEQ